jgi:hypothetical protein
MSMLTENRHVEKGCLMAHVSPTYGPHVIKLGRTAIPPQILYTDPNDPTFGYDTEPHVTLKYGFEPDLGKMNVAKILQGMKPFNIILKALNLFENDKFDVVKFEVQKCPILTELRRRCDGYPNSDSYPDYNPHMTLAYVKKGSFPHIKENLNIALPITRFKYSGPNGKYFINL